MGAEGREPASKARRSAWAHRAERSGKDDAVRKSCAGSRGQPRAGAEIYGRVGSLLEVGTGFHPELTGRENIYLNGAILGMTKNDINRKFDEIVAFSELEKFLDTKASEALFQRDVCASGVRGGGAPQSQRFCW